MSSRQRQPSGRSNSSQTQTTIAHPPSQRPLRLQIIPEDGSISSRTPQLKSSENRSSEQFIGTGRTLQEEDVSNVSSRLNTYKDVGDAFSSRPWAAPSVQNLTAQLGKTREAHALVVEGRHGDVLTAVGSEKDHSIANTVLSHAQEIERQKRREMMPSLHAGHTPRHLPASSRDATRTGPREFGVVYEHRDCFGKPKYVGHTSGVPEKRFSEDARKHQGVRNLLAYQQGRSDVVWAGSAAGSVGSSRAGAPGGTSTMKAITEGIVEQRAQEQHLQKLKGPKPYSRHGY
mmetsp:Transcript_19770/g.36825  ORF Transcript_19770/g.36825 Transcript_19770/m.36825 type:complete len:288 (-) Transcript_19770:22-885(-)